MPRQDASDLGRRPVLVVRERIDQERDAAGTVPLVAHLFVVDALELAGALLDRPRDVVRGHVGFFRRLNGEPQPGVPRGIPAALARGHGDLTDELREELSPGGVFLALFPFDLRPFRMT